MSPTLTLPWPPSSLSPNGQHGHWAVRAKAKKAYRTACYIAILEQRVARPVGDRFDVLLQFVPPDARRRDRDNLVASLKSGLDGLAEAWGIDDSQFVRVSAEVLDPDKAHSGVLVTVTAHVAAGAQP